MCRSQSFIQHDDSKKYTRMQVCIIIRDVINENEVATHKNLMCIMKHFPIEKRQNIITMSDSK